MRLIIIFFIFFSLRVAAQENLAQRLKNQQTDYSGCTKYGSEEYIYFYKSWSGFIKTYPTGYYYTVARGYLENFYIDARCSCDSKESTIRGLKKLRALVKDKETILKIDSELSNRARNPLLSETSREKLYVYEGESCGG